MAITYPITFPATPGPARAQWRATNSVGLVTTPHSWIERVQQNAGDLLRVEVDMPPMTRSLGEPWHAALMSLDGVFGTVLYGPGKYPRSFAVNQGVVGYHKDPLAAASDSRVAGNPVTIKGIGTAGSLSTDVVLASATAQQISGLDGFGSAISSCRVMFILD